MAPGILSAKPAIPTFERPRYNPWVFVLTLSFASAFPNATSQGVAALFYKSIGYSNEFVGYAGLLYLPFAAGFLWAPWIDRIGTKRGWLLSLSAGLALCFAVLALVAGTHPVSAWATLAAISAVAILGATAETAMNGYMLHAMDAEQQAETSGFRVGAIRGGIVLAGGILVKVSADYGEKISDPFAGWAALFWLIAVVFVASFAYHAWILPKPPTDKPVTIAPQTGLYRRTLEEFMRLPRVGFVVAFFLTYRLGEGLLTRMAPPFLLDAPARGGLGFSVSQVAVIQGTVGMICSIAGGILGGWMIKWFGLRRTALPFAAAMGASHLLYVWLALGHPEQARHAAQAVVGAEAFAYGLGFSMMYMLMVLLSRGEFRSSLSAILMGLWSVGWILPTFFSGLIQTHLGYVSLFVLSAVAALPGITLVCRLPLDQLVGSEAPGGGK